MGWDSEVGIWGADKESRGGVGRKGEELQPQQRLIVRVLALCVVGRGFESAGG